jgi:formate/nitrite transporter FocA (FNT family)
MAVLKTQLEGALSEPLIGLLVSNMYAVGFIFVVLGRSELFTEQTTLAVLPTLSGHASFRSLIRLWAVVYVANLLGATAFAWLSTQMATALGVVDPRALGSIAHRMTDHSGLVIFQSAVFAGWLMGLLSWLVAAGRDTISQIVLVWLVTTSIGLAKLHHVIVGTVEVLAGVFAGQSITAADFGRFLCCATIGNVVGGVIFVAFLKYGQARPAAQAAPAPIL